MAIIDDAYQQVFYTCQKDKESLQDYTRRFKTAPEVLQSQLGGPLQLKNYVMTMPTATTTTDSDLKVMHAKASQQFFLYLYLDNSDKNSLVKGLNSQKLLGNDQYPRTMAETNNILSNRRFDSSDKRNISPLSKLDDEDDIPSLSFA